MLPPLFSALRRPASKTSRKSTRLRIETLEAREVPAAFTPGNLVIFRVGDGSAALGSTGTAVFLDEYNPTTPNQSATVQSIALPGGASGVRLVSSGSATSEGLINRSVDRQYLTLIGYDAAIGTASVKDVTNRTIALIDPFGNIDMSTNGALGGSQNVSSVVTVDGSEYWYTHAEGFAHVTHGAGTITSLGTLNSRSIGIFPDAAGENQLYLSSNSGTNANKGVNKVGSGLPTSGTPTLARLPGLDDSTNENDYGYFFADLTASVDGPDTLYIADESTPGLMKWSLAGGSWTLTGAIGGNSDDYRGVTGVVSGTTVTLFATRLSKELVTLLDSSGYNGTLSGTPTLLATAATNTAFRGIALAPEHVNIAPVNALPSTFPDLTEDTAKVLVGLSVTDTDAGSGNIKVIISVPAGTGTFLLKDDVSSGVADIEITGNNSRIIEITSTVAKINATLAHASGLTFTPGADVNGDVTLTMVTNDQGNTGAGGAKQDTDTSTITIAEVNDAPTATDDGLSSFAEDSADRSIPFADLIGNDSSGPANEIGQALTIISVGNPVGGTVSISGPDVIFTPTLNFNGAASFDYLVEDNGTTNGSADFKSDTGRVTFTIDPVNDAPILDTAGTPMLPFIPKRGKVLSAGTEAGAPLSDLTENITDPDDVDTKGIAVTHIDNTNGVWEYNLAFNPADADAGWIAIPTSVSATNGLLLSDDGDTRVRFLPNLNFKNFTSLTFKAWDQSNAPLVEGALDTDLTTSAYSTADDQAWVAVGKTKPAVDADGRTILKPVKSDTKTSRAILVKDMIGIAGLESPSIINPGVAIIENNQAEGKWEFQLFDAQPKVWVEVGAVSPTSALLLRPTDKLRFAPIAGVDGDAELRFLTWNQTGTAGSKVNPTGVAFGVDPGTAILDLVPVLDLSAAGVLNPVGANGTTNAVAFSSLMNANHVVGANLGVAITATKGTGTWEYSLDGVTWKAVGKVSTGKALFLDDSVLIRFTSINATPGTASLSFKAWDLTKVAPGSIGVASGSSVSKLREIVSVSVANNPPTLDITPAVTLKPITVTTSAKPVFSGATVSTLLGTAFGDPDPKSLKGIAITGFTDNGGGKWQYLVAGSKVWRDLGTVGLDSAVLLASNARVRYFVDKPAITGPATISYKAWDRTTGQSGDRGVDTTGLLIAFSTGREETATISVTL